MAEFLRVREHPHTPEELIPLDAARLYLDELLARDGMHSPALANPAGWERLAESYPDNGHLIHGIAFSLITANRHRLARPAQRLQMERMFVPKGPFTQTLMADLLAARYVTMKRRSVEQEGAALQAEMFAICGPKPYQIQTIFSGIITEQIFVPIPAA